jgi:hypothetical protein
MDGSVPLNKELDPSKIWRVVKAPIASGSNQGTLFDRMSSVLTQHRSVHGHIATSMYATLLRPYVKRVNAAMEPGRPVRRLPLTSRYLQR